MINKGVKDFSFEEICPFPFDKSINMVSFPPGFDIPKFDKYTGETCPVTHLKKFSILYQDVAYSDDYLKRLFAWSLGGPALEWLMNLPKGSFASFNDLTSKFIAQYSYNIEYHASLSDLCNTKQWNGETFANFLQWWRHLTNHMHTKLRIPTLWIYLLKIWY